MLNEDDMEAIIKALEPQWVWVNPDPEANLGEWWTALHLAILPVGMPFAQAVGRTDVEVTLGADVDPLSSGLNEFHERFGGPDAPRGRVRVVIPSGALLRPYDKDDATEFRKVRDEYRMAHGLPRHVIRSDDYGRSPLYALQHPWPAGMFAQGGKTHTRVEATPEDEQDPEGYVHDGHKLVATGVFMEVFPRDPATFLRGEGPDFAAAEEALWAKWSRIVGCDSPTGSHEYETRGYRNGCGFCKHCGLFSSDVFDLASIGSVCAVCGVGTHWAHVRARNADGTLDKKNYEFVCEEHAPPSYSDFDAALYDEERLSDFGWATVHLPAREDNRFSFDEKWAAHAHGARDLIDAQIAARATGTEGI